MTQREYRGKAVVGGEWFFGHLLESRGKSFIVCECETDCPDGENTDLYATDWYEVDPDTVGQYTGLMDRNGKGRKMFEGDVYKQDSRHYVIEWSEYYLGWVVRSLKTGSVLPGHLKGEVSVYDDYEYVGSIHDHPHLLNKAE